MDAERKATARAWCARSKDAYARALMGEALDALDAAEVELVGPVFILKGGSSEDGRADYCTDNTIGYTRDPEVVEMHRAWIKESPYRFGWVTKVDPITECGGGS